MRREAKMKIELIITTDEDCGKRHRVFVDGKEKWYIGPLWECPEDAIIGRDLIDGYDLIEAVKLGFELGSNGGALVTEVEDRGEEE